MHGSTRAGSLLRPGSNDAVEASVRTLEIDPTNADAWYLKGSAIFATAGYEDAIEAFNKALEIKPDYVSAYYDKGRALYHMKMFKEAVLAFDNAISIQPKFVEALYQKGNAQIKLSAYDAAIVSFEQALKIRPNLGYIWTGKGIALSYWEGTRMPSTSSTRPWVSIRKIPWPITISGSPSCVSENTMRR